jgi:hypothetical protein
LTKDERSHAGPVALDKGESRLPALASFGTKLLANPVHEELDATAPGTDVNIKTLSVNE